MKDDFAVGCCGFVVRSVPYGVGALSAIFASNAAYLSVALYDAIQSEDLTVTDFVPVTVYVCSIAISASASFASAAAAKEVHREILELSNGSNVDGDSKPGGQEHNPPDPQAS